MRIAPLFQADLESVEESGGCSLKCKIGSVALWTSEQRRAIPPPRSVRNHRSRLGCIHNVNLKATFFCCQQGALLMKKTGAGRIVNISSLGGIRPWECTRITAHRKPA